MFQKERKMIWMVWVTCGILFLCACSGKKDVQDFYDNAKLMSVNISNENLLCFDMVFLTKEKAETVEVVKIMGDGVTEDTFYSVVINNTLNLYRNNKYNGLFCSDWMFELKTNIPNLECCIKSVVVKVDGVERNIWFDEPLVYSNKQGNDIMGEDLQLLSFANEFPSSIINSGSDACYEFVANKKMTIEALKMANDMNIGIKVFLNDDHTVEQSLPVEVEAGTKVCFMVEFNSKKWNQLYYVTSNLQILYTMDGQKTTRSGVVVFNPVSPMDEKLEKMKMLMDAIIGE